MTNFPHEFEETAGEKLIAAAWVRMKKNNQKRGAQAKVKRVADRAMSRIVEGKKRHRRHGKRKSA
jgi:hypothetical protein